MKEVEKSDIKEGGIGPLLRACDFGGGYRPDTVTITVNDADVLRS